MKVLKYTNTMLLPIVLIVLIVLLSIFGLCLNGTIETFSGDNQQQEGRFFYQLKSWIFINPFAIKTKYIEKKKQKEADDFIKSKKKISVRKRKRIQLAKMKQRDAIAKIEKKLKPKESTALNSKTAKELREFIKNEKKNENEKKTKLERELKYKQSENRFKKMQANEAEEEKQKILERIARRKKQMEDVKSIMGVNRRPQESTSLSSKTAKELSRIYENKQAKNKQAKNKQVAEKKKEHIDRIKRKQSEAEFKKIQEERSKKVQANVKTRMEEKKTMEIKARKMIEPSWIPSREEQSKN